MSPTDEMAAKPDAAGFGGEPDQQLRTILENLQRVGQRSPVEEDEPVERDDLRPGFTSRLDQEASERKAIYDRLVAIENEMKRRGSRGFVRYLVAICIGVAGTLAWQSYGDAAKQIIATRAPELGWSPDAKQMIASWTLGWTKPPAGSEKQALPLAQIAPSAPSIDAEKVQQLTQSLAVLRQTVEQLAAGQDQMTRVIGRLESAVTELIVKTPEPPPQPPAAPARKPTPAPPSSRTPGPPPTSRAIPPPHP
jgi:hypothetical protein